MSDANDPKTVFERMRDLESYAQILSIAYCKGATEEQERQLRGTLTTVATVRLQLAFLRPDIIVDQLPPVRSLLQSRAEREWSYFDNFKDRHPESVYVNPEEASEPGTTFDGSRDWN